MKTHSTIALAMLAGFGLGTVAVQGLHAQAKALVYQVTEVDIQDAEAYARDFTPKASAALKAAGGKIIALGKATALDGDPPKTRIVISQWDSIEQIKAYRESAAFKDLQAIRAKLAKFRTYAIEGTAQ